MYTEYLVLVVWAMLHNRLKVHFALWCCVVNLNAIPVESPDGIHRAPTPLTGHRSFVDCSCPCAVQNLSGLPTSLPVDAIVCRTNCKLFLETASDQHCSS